MKLERRLRSAARLPRRLARGASIAVELAGFALAFRLRTGLRRREHARLVRRSALFDVDFYLAQCGDDRGARADPWTHYLASGAGRGLSPSPLFDPGAYVARHPEAAGENPLVHYLLAERARDARAPARVPPSLDPREAARALAALAGEGAVAGGGAGAAPGAAALPTAGAACAGAERPRVLAAGVYLADRENHAADIARELAASERWSVEQRWIALGKAPIPEALANVTAWRQRSRAGKFVLLNRLLAQADPGRYEFVVFVDDDIVLPPGFVDRYLELVLRHDLALAQPARTHDSYTDNWIVERLDGLDARRTRFVEIGPLFSMRRDALRLLTPFDLASPMGWGYDFVWPVAIEEAGLRMGIVDATPVAHNLRKPVAFYDDRDAAIGMQRYLSTRRHLGRHDAFLVLEAWS